MRATPVLSVKELSVAISTRAGDLTAIDGISFDIAAGEILGVVGESGAGKSLTGMAVLRLLDGAVRQSGGRISLNGRRIDDLDDEAMRALRGREIGAVFQDPLTSLDPLMQIGDHLIETIRTHLPVTLAEAKERALALLQEVGVPSPRERMASWPHELSGGMRQRVVLALAFACEPSLIIADEPTTALDVSVQAQVIDVMRTMCAQRETAVMLVTHDMGVIAEAADRVAVMYAGRIVEIGPTDTILNAPAHPYTRGLVACIPSMVRGSGPLAQIAGAMPKLDALPRGCAYSARCSDAVARCFEDRPALKTSGETAAACFVAARTHGAFDLLSAQHPVLRHA